MDAVLAIHQPDLRLAIDLLLREDPGVEVVGVANDSNGLLALLHSVHPYLVIVDWDLPHRTEIDWAAEFRKLSAPLWVIALINNDQDQKAVVASGANSCMVKGEPAATLLELIDQAGTSSLPSTEEETE